MKELIKQEYITGTQKTVVGTKATDLVLRSGGKIYIQQGSRFLQLQDYLKTSNLVQDQGISVEEVYVINTMNYNSFQGQNMSARFGSVVTLKNAITSKKVIVDCPTTGGYNSICVKSAIEGDNIYIYLIDATKIRKWELSIQEDGENWGGGFATDTYFGNTEHTHDEYALTDHTHSEYAQTRHSHSEYALTQHTHETLDHGHNITQIVPVDLEQGSVHGISTYFIESVCLPSARSVNLSSVYESLTNKPSKLGLNYTLTAGPEDTSNQIDIFISQEDPFLSVWHDIEILNLKTSTLENTLTIRVYSSLFEAALGSSSGTLNDKGTISELRGSFSNLSKRFIYEIPISVIPRGAVSIRFKLQNTNYSQGAACYGNPVPNLHCIIK